MKKILLIAALLLPMLTQALPFVPTTNPETYPIHWYQLKTGSMYIYASPDPTGMDDDIKVSSSASTADNYLWCFVGDTSSGYKIYNKSTKTYLYAGPYLGNSSESSIDMYEAGSGNNFYIYCIFGIVGSSQTLKNYLCYRSGQGFYTTMGRDSYYTVTEALVEDFIDPSGQIVFSDLETYNDHCVIDFTYTGNEECHYIFKVNGTQVAAPYSITRTDEDQTVEAVVIVNFTNPRINSITASRTYVIPASEDSGPNPTLTFTAYDYYIPHNSLDNYGAEGYAKLFDKNKSTKWCVVNNSGAWETIWVDFKSNISFYPSGYIFTTGNDTQRFNHRNPKAWTIYGKESENDSWTTLVTITNGEAAGLGSNNTTDYSFKINGVTKKYQFFRFEVSEVVGKDNWDQNNYVFQLAELELLGGSTIIGDVNGDGRVNVSDVSALINMILGLTTMDNDRADVNGDGRVNVSDVSALINIILGI